MLLDMTEELTHSAATAGWCSLITDLDGASAALATIAGLRPSRGRPRARMDEHRLQQAVAVCGYDAHRIARHLGITLRYLQRWFSTHMAATPGVWLAEQRLQHARRLLAASSSVKEVAYSLGFKHHSQFSRDFRRRFGHQPSVEQARARVGGLRSHAGEPVELHRAGVGDADHSAFDKSQNGSRGPCRLAIAQCVGGSPIGVV